MQKKKIVAVALAGFMAFGAASVSLGSVSEAAHHKQVEQHHYEDGTTNEYSHRMKEEDKLHTSRRQRRDRQCGRDRNEVPLF